MAAINLDMLRELLNEFTEKENVLREERDIIQEQIVELDARVESNKIKLAGLTRDRDKIDAMRDRYLSGNWQFVPNPETASEESQTASHINAATASEINNSAMAVAAIGVNSADAASYTANFGSAVASEVSTAPSVGTESEAPPANQSLALPATSSAFVEPAALPAADPSMPNQYVPTISSPLSRSASIISPPSGSVAPVDLSAASPAPVLMPIQEPQAVAPAPTPMPMSEPQAVAPVYAPAPEPQPVAPAPTPMPMPEPQAVAPVYAPMPGGQQPTAPAPVPVPMSEPQAVAPVYAPMPEQQPAAIAYAPMPGQQPTAPATVPMPMPEPQAVAPAYAPMPEQQPAATAYAQMAEQQPAATAYAPMPEQQPAATAYAQMPEQQPAAITYAPMPEQQPAATAYAPMQEQQPAAPATVPMPMPEPQAVAPAYAPMPEQQPAAIAYAQMPEQQPAATAYAPMPEQQPAATAYAPMPEQQPAATAYAPMPEQQPAATAYAPMPEQQPAATAYAPMPEQQPAATAYAPMPEQQPAATAYAPMPEQQPAAPQSVVMQATDATQPQPTFQATSETPSISINSPGAPEQLQASASSQFSSGSPVPNDSMFGSLGHNETVGSADSIAPPASPEINHHATDGSDIAAPSGFDQAQANFGYGAVADAAIPAATSPTASWGEAFAAVPSPPTPEQQSIPASSYAGPPTGSPPDGAAWANFGEEWVTPPLQGDAGVASDNLPAAGIPLPAPGAVAGSWGGWGEAPESPPTARPANEDLQNMNWGVATPVAQNSNTPPWEQAPIASPPSPPIADVNEQMTAWTGGNAAASAAPPSRPVAPGGAPFDVWTKRQPASPSQPQPVFPSANQPGATSGGNTSAWGGIGAPPADTLSSIGTNSPGGAPGEDPHSSLSGAIGGALLANPRNRRRREPQPGFDWGGDQAQGQQPGEASAEEQSSGGAQPVEEIDEGAKKINDALRGLFRKST